MHHAKLYLRLAEGSGEHGPDQRSAPRKAFMLFCAILAVLAMPTFSISSAFADDGPSGGDTAVREDSSGSGSGDEDDDEDDVTGGSDTDGATDGATDATAGATDDGATNGDDGTTADGAATTGGQVAARQDDGPTAADATGASATDSTGASDATNPSDAGASATDGAGTTDDTNPTEGGVALAQRAAAQRCVKAKKAARRVHASQRKAQLRKARASRSCRRAARG